MWRLPLTTTQNDAIFNNASTFKVRRYRVALLNAHLSM
jgi:DNA mismatch repair protein MSH6